MDCMFRAYDIIALTEIKTSQSVHFPGKTVGSVDRGGIVVFVKNHLCNFVHNVDLSAGDQIWLQLCMIEQVLFGFCYVPPCDSQYYSHDAFASIQEKITSNHMGNGYVIMGDMNARFGRAVGDLVTMYELPGMEISSPVIDDDVANMNENAEFLSVICMDSKLVVLNSLKTPQKHFVSGKTFWKRNSWVSELDTCIVSPSLVNHVLDFAVTKRLDLRSDHAPISISLNDPRIHMDNVLARAALLHRVT